MSMLLRRSLVRAVPRARGFATTTSEGAKSSWEAKQAALRSHAAGTSSAYGALSASYKFDGFIQKPLIYGGRLGMYLAQFLLK